MISGYQRLLASLWRPKQSQPARPPRAKLPPKPTRAYYWRLGGNVGGKVFAKNRCDARVEIKRALGIPIKQRLPVGIEIEAGYEVEAPQEEA